MIREIQNLAGICDPKLNNQRVVEPGSKGMTTYKYVRILVCLSLIVVSLAYPTTARACSCLEPGLPAQEFRESNAVFTGRVLGIVDEYVPVFSTLDRILTALGKQPYFWVRAGKYVGYRIHFRVHNSWKGVEMSTIVVDTGYGMGDCGYPFAVSNDYLVYASYPSGIPDDYWVTSICSRNAEISAASTDLMYLNSLPRLQLTSSIEIFGLPLSVIAVWAFFALIASVIFLFVQKPRI